MKYGPTDKKNVTGLYTNYNDSTRRHCRLMKTINIKDDTAT